MGIVGAAGPPGSRVEPGHLAGSPELGGRVAKSLGEERGREQRKRRVGRKDGGALPSSQPWERWWSGPAS